MNIKQNDLRRIILECITSILQEIHVSSIKIGSRDFIKNEFDHLEETKYVICRLNSGSGHMEYFSEEGQYLNHKWSRNRDHAMLFNDQNSAKKVADKLSKDYGRDIPPHIMNMSGGSLSVGRKNA